MLTGLVIVIAVVAIVYLFMQGPQFGQVSRGERSKKISASPNFRSGQFQNQHETPTLAEGTGIFEATRKFFFEKDKRNKPAAVIPSTKTNLHSLLPGDNVLVWFGHSSYFMQLNGKKILVDPVLSGNASPFSFTTASFRGSDVYIVEDLPDIDYLFITHDHYDHLDHKTVTQLRSKVGKVITGLGVGSHLERWGYNSGMITELDWGQSAEIDKGFLVHATPARHFSGRSFRRNGTLWLSFVLQTPGFKIFLGGDSGYDDHFVTIGDQHGPFDLAILEAGQYNKYWKYIHMMPEEAVQAAIDLKAKALMPVHWSKFSLSIHAWDEPIIRVTAEAKRKGLNVVHPMIGEALHLAPLSSTSQWWEKVEVIDNPAK
jgi:L-ascorbate metabolism protein UlaG (beta-lactamase superfamily)